MEPPQYLFLLTGVSLSIMSPWFTHVVAGAWISLLFKGSAALYVWGTYV